ncbi:Receptor-type tyrosine-protein phosphatase beta [Echinococcus granulosus]|uniref:Receptor-type tyrosine-protein phosphatase beta n=1 Tax=Echinococcus granulosus TaxID=6210 RepID=W6U3D6_ECHGR|nr:Receptor-type tyrosine-protein phosphatase beta [Echinococcus granulosus]EUB55061.1 Receptor-type tyrosine-protein phosphatase beta [Echinococcus granulosus]
MELGAAPCHTPQREMYFITKFPQSLLKQLGQFLADESTTDYKKLRQQFAKLTDESTQEVRNGNKASVCGTLLGNVAKNRYTHILPYDRYRVILGRTWDDFQRLQTVQPSLHSSVGNYINASYIGVCNTDINGKVFSQESIAKPRFITTQDPLENTIGDFWKMVYEQQVPTIIRLSESSEYKDEVLKYWPQEKGEKASYATNPSKMWVRLLHEEQKPVWMERSFKIWLDGHKNLSMFVHHLQYVGWMTNCVPASTNLLKFIDDVTNPLVPIATTAGPMVVQCRGGIGRNGFFVAASLIKENIEMGIKGVDIYNTIKQLRNYQMALVNSVDYYIELHNFALQAYLQAKGGGCKYLEYKEFD